MKYKFHPQVEVLKLCILKSLIKERLSVEIKLNNKKVLNGEIEDIDEDSVLLILDIGSQADIQVSDIRGIKLQECELVRWKENIMDSLIGIDKEKLKEINNNVTMYKNAHCLFWNNNNVSSSIGIGGGSF